MRMLKLLCLTAAATLPVMVACGGDDDSDKPGGSGAAGGTAGSGNAAGMGGSGNAAGMGGSGNAAGSGGTGGSGNAAGTGGSAGSGGASCDLTGAGLPEESIPTQITADTTLTSDKVWKLEDKTYVNDGATLTIEPCTVIKGSKSPLGTLIVSRGGKIMADGTADEPILFTSALPTGARNAGDWGGVILLGRAPNFKGSDVTIEGLADAPENQYGGTDAADSSGSMTYVRIEYSGFELSADNEINGLTLGSVGSGTQLSYVMVSNTLDDGFEWFGGGMTAHHLVVNNAGDDMFDVDQGFQGDLQFLFGRQVTPLTSNPNGFECDSSNAGDMPTTTVNISNVTLCGLGTAGANETYGGVLRENLEGTYMNMIITGFDFGIDARDDFGTPAAPKVNLTDSTFFGNFTSNISNHANETGADDNDMGFDEEAWFNDAARNNDTTDPGFSCGPSGTPDPRPAAEIAGGTPTGANDASATYRGAFKDASDNWMTGAWVDWSAN